MDKIQNLTAGLNWYDLMRPHKIGPSTLMSDSPDRYRSTLVNGKNVTYKRGYTFSEMFGWHKKHPGVQMAQKYAEVVIAGNITDYMNNQTVRDALHITTDKVWEQCDGYINENYQEQLEASLWIYRIFKY